MSDSMMIMKLVEEGKLTAEEAGTLLKKLEEAGKRDEVEFASKVNYLRVKLEDIRANRTVMDSKLPVLLVQVGIQMGRKLWKDALRQYPDLRHFNINFREIYSRIKQDEPGKVAELTSKDGTQRLTVWLE